MKGSALCAALLFRETKNHWSFGKIPNFNGFSDLILF